MERESNSILQNSDKPKSRIKKFKKKRDKKQVTNYKYSLVNDYLMHPNGLNPPVKL